MKYLIPLTAIAAIASSVIVSAQTPAYSKPSGYVTQSLSVGFNLVSVTLQKPAIFTAALSGVNGVTLSFAAAHNLPAGKLLILEVVNGSGASASVVQDFNIYSGNTITLPNSISGLVQGDTIAVRESTTLEEIFGTTLASASNSASSDIVWLPTGGGQFDRYYRRTPFSGTPIWRKLNPTEVDAPNTPVVYLDGMFVEVKATTKTITVTGQVKTSPTNFAIQSGFNLIGTIYPVGSTLTSSGLQAQLATAANSASSDIVWISTGPGSFSRYYYRTPFSGSPGWRTLTPVEAAVDGSTVTLPSSIFIERKGSAKNITITPPSSYSSL